LRKRASGSGKNREALQRGTGYGIREQIQSSGSAETSDESKVRAPYTVSRVPYPEPRNPSRPPRRSPDTFKGRRQKTGVRRQESEETPGSGPTFWPPSRVPRQVQGQETEDRSQETGVRRDTRLRPNILAPIAGSPTSSRAGFRRQESSIRSIVDGRQLKVGADKGRSRRMSDKQGREVRDTGPAMIK